MSENARVASTVAVVSRIRAGKTAGEGIFAMTDMEGQRLECGFLGFDNGITGFAWDPDHPDRALDVELVVAGEPIATMRADLPDDRLPGRVGAHVFRFFLDRVPSLPCDIAGRVRGLIKTFGPVRIQSAAELANVVAPAVRYEGHVEELVPGKGRIQGWVLDRFKPEARVRVTLRDWEEPLTAARADLYRATLERAGRGDGRCAFVIHLPVEILDDQEHTLRVTVEDTNFAIPGSPILFQPEMARELVEIIAPWRDDVLRIEWIVERLDELAERGVSAATGVNKLIDELFATRATKHVRASKIRSFSEAFLLPSKKRR